MNDFVPWLRNLLSSRWGKLACWFGLFTLLAAVDTTQTYVAQRFEDVNITWALAIRRGLESNYLMAILGLGVLQMGSRFSLDRMRASRWVGIHFCFSLAFALIFSLAYAAFLDGQMSVKGKPFVFAETLNKLVVFYTPGYVGLYWIILLSHHGWHYYHRSRDREKRAADLEGQLARARLDALRMQLNPHFLFNTLNTVVALIHEQPELADRTVTRLSELLRLSLDRSSQYEVPLRQEIAFLEKYLDIEKIRFGERLRVEIEVPASLMDAMVPALVLQPIVENAIRHGIEQLEQAGRIRIAASLKDSSLLLTVQDNGPGLSEKPPTYEREGIGLSNTRSRLRHLYADCQSLELKPGVDGGLEVHILLPYRSLHEPIPQPRCGSVVVGCLERPAKA